MQQGLAQSSNVLETLQRYADLFTFAPVGYVVLGHHAHVEDVNRAAAEILGYPRTWILGQPVTRWIVKKDVPRFREYLRDVYARGETVVDDFRVRDRKSRLRDVRLATVAMVARGGKRLCQASIEDVTQERLAAREARQLQDELAHVARLNSCGEMVAALAHELNQPIGAISLYCSAALKSLRGERDPRQLESALEKIAAAASHAAGTIRSLRSFLGKADPVIEEVDVNGVLADVTRMAGAYAKERGGRIEVEPAEGLAKWRGNKIHLQQVLLNLLQNGLDAIHSTGCAGGRVLVKSREEEEEGVLVISVEDTGPGMTPMQRRRALEPFFTTKKNGMGVGLPISRSIVQSYGGTLTVDSAESGGTVVSFTLPIKR
ncbi:MAG TPA: ATP-binding protein [Gammaproteobacteria bacterium]|nr:ATP-binding protein [Gammaproteobacteria bacterium]